MKSTLRLLAAIILSSACGAGLMWYFMSRPAPQAGQTQPEPLPLATAKEAMIAGNFPAARELARQFPPDHSDYATSLLELGELATRLDKEDESLWYYELIPQVGSDADLRARFVSGEFYMNQGRYQEADEAYRYFLKFFPNHSQAINRLSLLMDYSNKRYDASQLMFQLVKLNAFSTHHLLFLADSISVHEPAPEVKRTEPDKTDSLVNLANARYQLWRGELDSAEAFFRKALELDPELIEAHVRLGEIWLRRDRLDKLEEWQSQLPEKVKGHPGYWHLLGQWAEDHQDPRGAARAFWECLKLDPNIRTANYRLGMILPLVGMESKAGFYLDRATELQELSRAIDILYLNEGHLESMRIACQKTEKMGRIWEAVGWARSILILDRNAADAKVVLERLGGQIDDSLPRMLPDLDPARQIDLSAFEVPQIRRAVSSGGPVGETGEETQVRFSNDAQTLGIDFAYFHGPDPTTASGRMFEFTGGGVAAIDYDLDGMPDLYFPQGCEWPPVAGQNEYLDRMFRNSRGQFRDVTLQAGLFEDRFGQGVNVGDIDQDGFPDLYVANTHVNRLWRNLGDGTFEDATETSGITASEWTTSCLIADLNGDTYPEVVDINYATGDDLFSRICESEGIARSCSPLVFKAANDRLLVNLGTGQFRDESTSGGFETGDGRGLGIVAFSAGAVAKRPDLFVANDMTANFLFVNESPAQATAVSLLEQGIVSGLAFDVEGTAQASMGVASADADGNGLLDLFVTNFYAEANNLYLQQPEGGFVDSANPSGLRLPGYAMLGFGTQFLDANLDGWPDLFVANGHVDDFRHKNIPYYMRAQFFENQGEARYVERRGAQIGPFFDEERLGRGVAKLDWNRDRKEDLVISYLESPVALLTNQSEGATHSVSVRLVGTSVDREAVGSVIRLKCEDREFVAQITGGDGYMASNERRIVFGLGNRSRIESLRVEWTDGSRSEYIGLDTDTDYIIQQGRSEPLSIR